MLLIIAGVLRRIHVLALSRRDIRLDADQARHARDVLRLEPGTMVEVFDDAGGVASGELVLDGKFFAVRITHFDVKTSGSDSFRCTIASAVPKGDRADWMVEKLSELGVSEFIPLTTLRSVVHPEGKGKRDRWARLAIESAKQSRRSGVMTISELSAVGDVLARVDKADGPTAWYFSTREDARPFTEVIATVRGDSLTAFVGPEGGWADEELAAFDSAGIRAVHLPTPVLRVETAAVAAATLIACVVAPKCAIHLDARAAMQDDPAAE